MHFLVYGVTPQLDHHLAPQKHRLLWALCPPGGPSRFSHVKTSAFPSPASAPLLSFPLCLLVGHLVWIPSYNLPGSRRKTKLIMSLLQLLLSPHHSLCCKTNYLSVPQVGIRFVCVLAPSFSATIIFLKGFLLLQNSLLSPSDSP